MKNNALMWIGACLLALAGSAQAAGNAKKGADVFAEECGDCHSVIAGKHKKAPSLHGVLGRKAGSVTDFSGYSDAMKQSAIVWDTEKVEAYITHPRKVVPGGKMKYDGLEDAEARADVIAFLKSVK